MVEKKVGASNRRKVIEYRKQEQTVKVEWKE